MGKALVAKSYITPEYYMLQGNNFKGFLFNLIILFVFGATIGKPVFAQTLAIDWVEVSGMNIIVHYDLTDENPMHAYTVHLYSSKDNFAAPLLKLSGDHGNEVKPGIDKQIVWKITEELGQYAGEIELEIRAKMYVPFLNMTAFKANARYKRGKNYPLVWKSGNPGGQVDIELYLQNTRIHSDRNVQNSGKFDWQIPASVRPSGGYRLKFTNTKSREETYYTPPFRIVHKIPMAAKIGTAAVIGAAIIYFLTSNSVQEDPDLPPADFGSPNN
jgi:Ser-Thr-rich glycosyl-phosphatidyl-inositol-anchored membrane family